MAFGPGQVVGGARPEMDAARRTPPRRTSGPAPSRSSGRPRRLLLVPGMFRPSRAWLERTTNLVRPTELALGGHVAPFEEPRLHAEDSLLTSTTLQVSEWSA